MINLHKRKMKARTTDTQTKAHKNENNSNSLWLCYGKELVIYKSSVKSLLYVLFQHCCSLHNYDFVIFFFIRVFVSMVMVQKKSMYVFQSVAYFIFVFFVLFSFPFRTKTLN